MKSSSTPAWIAEILQTELSPENLKQVKTYFDLETWAAPSSLHRLWKTQEQEESMPRFCLDIDVKF